MTTDTIELEEALPRRERRKLLTPVGVVAGAIAIAALGFLGGVEAQKSQGASGGATAGAFPGGAGGAPSGAAGAGGGRQGQGQPDGNGRQANATVGEVASVDGKAIYVDDSSGNTVRVRVADGGTVTRTAKAKLEAIHPGDTVIVQGETSSNGTVVATSIRATASNAAGALGGFGGGPPGGGGFPGGGAAPSGG